MVPSYVQSPTRGNRSLQVSGNGAAIREVRRGLLGRDVGSRDARV